MPSGVYLPPSKDVPILAQKVRHPRTYAYFSIPKIFAQNIDKDKVSPITQIHAIKASTTTLHGKSIRYVCMHACTDNLIASLHITYCIHTIRNKKNPNFFCLSSSFYDFIRFFFKFNQIRPSKSWKMHLRSKNDIEIFIYFINYGKSIGLKWNYTTNFAKDII